jgi:hypothetical protein
VGPARSVIAWDVDDVLNALMRRWLERFEQESGVSVPYASLRENPPDGLLGLSRAQYLASLDAFRLEQYASLEPSPRALEWFAEHGDATTHIAVTATPLCAAERTVAWVRRHFGRWIADVRVVPSPRPDDPVPQPPPDKGALLAALGGQFVLVDDSPAQVAHARAHGVRAILYPQPWNEAAQPAAAVWTELARIARGSE